MEKKTTAAAQDLFLNVLRKNKNFVTVFLMNGIKLQGIITGFDQFVLFLKKEDITQLVYKHSISTILPGEPIVFLDTAAKTPE